MQVNILEAKNRLSQLIKSAQAGEEVVIANRGEPRRPIGADRPARTRSPASAPPPISSRDSKQNPLPAHSRRTVEEIDACIAEERASWD